jgi:hypothetical protein
MRWQNETGTQNIWIQRAEEFASVAMWCVHTDSDGDTQESFWTLAELHNIYFAMQDFIKETLGVEALHLEASKIPVKRVPDDD